jgi:hypothetical protein
MAPKFSYTDPFTAPTIEVFISTKPNVEELKSERNNTTQLRVTIMKFYFYRFLLLGARAATSSTEKICFV